MRQRLASILWRPNSTGRTFATVLQHRPDWFGNHQFREHFLHTITGTTPHHPSLAFVLSWANTAWFWPVFDPILEPRDSFYSWAKFPFHRVLFPVQCTEGSNGQLSTPDWPSNDQRNFWHLWPQLYADVTDDIGITNPVNCLSGGGFCLNWDFWHCMWQ